MTSATQDPTSQTTPLCPVRTAEYDLFDPEFLADSFFTFARERAASPVHYVPSLDAYAITRYPDVTAALLDTDSYSFRGGLDSLFGEVPDEVRPRMPIYPITVPALGNNDPPSHTRIRQLCQGAFTARAVLNWQTPIRHLCEQMVGQFAAERCCELKSQFAGPLPVAVSRLILDLPASNEQVDRWTAGALRELTNPRLDHQRRVAIAVEHADFADCVRTTIDHRRRAPGEDLLSNLIHAQADGQSALTDNELLSIAMQLVIAGTDTVTHTLTATVETLCRQPDLMSRVRADHSLIPKTIEETLRRHGTLRYISYRTIREVDIDGCRIPAGARVVLLLDSANHDDTVFDRPQDIDIDRPNLSRHVGFGRGPHSCIGAALARLELRLAVETLLTRLPNLQLANPDITHEPNPFIRAISSLELEWDPRRVAIAAEDSRCAQ